LKTKKKEAPQNLKLEKESTYGFGEEEEDGLQNFQKKRKLPWGNTALSSPPKKQKNEPKNFPAVVQPVPEKKPQQIVMDVSSDELLAKKLQEELNAVDKLPLKKKPG